MQTQGRSNYCGLCAINNAYGNESFTVESLENIADDFWLRQLEQLGMNVTEELQVHRDTNGFYSKNTLEEVVECLGHDLPCLLSVTPPSVNPPSITNTLTF